jgi:hypothetical protein
MRFVIIFILITSCSSKDLNIDPITSVLNQIVKEANK